MMRDMAGRGHTGSLDNNMHDSMLNNGLCFEEPGTLEDTAAYDQPLSPYSRSPWSAHVSGHLRAASTTGESSLPYELVGSLVREEGHIYSLAATKELLYTGSDSKNIRVWKNQSEYAGFKSNSGLVKAIVTSGDKIFTGHQDGRIRVWKYLTKTNGETHKRITTLPTLRHYIKAAMKPSNYIEVKKKRSALWIKHVDCISSLSLTEDQSFLYSASWDKTFKVWRTSDFKCLESVKAHSDAVNSLIAGFSGYVFTGSADGTVKAWSRELRGKSTKHALSKTLLSQDCAVTSLTLNSDWSVLYSGSSNGLINFWERDKALAHGGVLRGHKLGVLCLAAAGSLIFSGSADMSIRMWRRTNKGDHVCLSILAGHTGPVKCLAVEEDSELKSASERQWVVYSGSLDKSVKIWRVSEHS